MSSPAAKGSFDAQTLINAVASLRIANVRFSSARGYAESAGAEGRGQQLPGSEAAALAEGAAEQLAPIRERFHSLVLQLGQRIAVLSEMGEQIPKPNVTVPAQELSTWQKFLMTEAVSSTLDGYEAFAEANRERLKPLHHVLDIVATVPAAGTIANAANSIVYGAFELDAGNAALSAGLFATGGTMNTAGKAGAAIDNLHDARVAAAAANAGNGGRGALTAGQQLAGAVGTGIDGLSMANDTASALASAEATVNDLQQLADAIQNHDGKGAGTHAWNAAVNAAATAASTVSMAGTMHRNDELERAGDALNASRVTPPPPRPSPSSHTPVGDGSPIEVHADAPATQAWTPQSGLSSTNTKPLETSASAPPPPSRPSQTPVGDGSPISVNYDLTRDGVWPTSEDSNWTGKK